MHVCEVSALSSVRLATLKCTSAHSTQGSQRQLDPLNLSCHADGGRPALFRIDSVTTERRTGFYKPLTASGTIVVDGVVASVHSSWFADAAMDRLGLTHAIPALYQVHVLAA